MAPTPHLLNPLPAPSDREDDPYGSFWMAGFEGADHVNAHAQPQDLVRMTGHLAHLDDDYRRVAALGLRTIRESVGWRLAEPTAALDDARWAATGRFDLTRTLRCADAANRHGLQVLWTLMHYGFPRGVDVFADEFAERFADFAAATARALRGLSERAAVYTPINEISFLAWAIAETNFIHPYRDEARLRQSVDGPRHDVGWEVKWRLIRAALLAMKAIRAEDPRARFLHVEPLTHVVPPPNAPHLAWRADEIGNYQWQAWDMLSGFLCPELGGSPEALDLLGVNYYHNCQWEMATGARLEWHLDDPRRVSLSSLLRKTSKRFGRPLVIAETSHVGSGRARWLDDVTGEVERARAGGVQVQGLCLYPVIDRPDWNNFAHWHNSGLWDIEGPRSAPEGMKRRLHLGYAKSLRRAQRRLPRGEVATTPMRHLIVFSHLRWDSVHQRPQQLLSRLARDYHVVFIEEPVRTVEAACMERSTPRSGVEVLRPHTPIDAAGFHDEQLATVQPLIASYLAENLIDDYLIWFCTPMALPLLNDLAPRAIVYDCMDELAALENAPRQMRQRETALLRSADVVFTSCPSLHEAKGQLGRSVLCLPSGVDAGRYPAHGAAADAGAVRLAEDLQGSCRGPRLGFFGVVDERIDLDLVARVADSDPSWQLIMVGPVVRIDPADLPRRANLRWLGAQPDELLPQLVASWDVCIMPFAVDESTAFLSPTETLECMAAGKAVVATAIRDVEAMFGDLVAIADSSRSFIGACRAALAESVSDAAERRARMLEVVRCRSWTAVADTVRDALEAAIERNTSQPADDASLLLSHSHSHSAADAHGLLEPIDLRDDSLEYRSHVA